MFVVQERPSYTIQRDLVAPSKPTDLAYTLQEYKSTTDTGGDSAALQNQFESSSAGGISRIAAYIVSV